MSAVILHRRDPARNLHRFYRLDVQPDLFGQWCLIRAWGRIGSAGGQTRTVTYFTYFDAEAALEKQRRCPERKGYVSSCPVSAASKSCPP
jgi:predicted DNA-binding WGR domain protein